MDSEHNIYEVCQTFINGYVTDENIKELNFKINSSYVDKAHYLEDTNRCIRYYLSVRLDNRSPIYIGYEIPYILTDIMLFYGIQFFDFFDTKSDRESISSNIHAWFNQAYLENIVKSA